MKYSLPWFLFSFKNGFLGGVGGGGGEGGQRITISFCSAKLCLKTFFTLFIQRLTPGNFVHAMLPFKIKGQLQRQNKLISSERPFKIQQNETKIIKIGQAVLEIYNFKDRDWDNFTRKNDRKTENVVLLWKFCKS